MQAGGIWKFHIWMGIPSHYFFSFFFFAISHALQFYCPLNLALKDYFFFSTFNKESAKELMLFELWCWRRFLRVPWTARRSNQSILKKISSEYSLEGLMVKLKLQYYGHLMRKSDSLEKTLMRGKNWRWEEKGMTEDDEVGWHHQLNGHEFE